MIELRPYQQAAFHALAEWDYSQGNPLVVVPTGGGKSLIQAAAIQQMFLFGGAARFLCVTHVKELVQQNHDAYLRLRPGADAGIYSAGIGRRDRSSRVLFAGIQSIHRSIEKIGRFDAVIVDECHLIPAKSESMYRKVFAALRETNPDIRIIGLTATPFRTDSGSLHKGDDRLFHGIAYECDLVSLIEQGYLSNVTCRGTKASIDTKGVHTRQGEFVAEELEQRAMADGLVDAAMDELVQRAGDRRSWLLFCTGVDHANAVSDRLNSRGIACATVFGHTPNEERDEVIRAYKAGEIRAIANVAVLVTGFDAPQTDLIALLTATKSPVRYVQCVGRGLRTAEGKRDCLLLDFGGNVMRHGPINDIELSEAGATDGEKREAPLRECEHCHAFSPISALACIECGAVFPREMAANHGERPDEDVVIIRTKEGVATGEEKWKIVRTVYLYHPPKNPGGHATLRVIYHGKRKNVSQYLCFEHPRESYARMKAERWWGRVTSNKSAHAPTRVGEAIRLIQAGAIVCEPCEVTVRVTGTWPEVVRLKLHGAKETSPTV